MVQNGYPTPIPIPGVSKSLLPGGKQIKKNYFVTFETDQKFLLFLFRLPKIVKDQELDSQQE